MSFKRIAHWLVACSLAALACTSGGDLVSPDGLIAPDTIKADVLGIHSVRVRWTPVNGAATYELERRANLTGSFEPVQGGQSSGTEYLDTSVLPQTFYGYRVVAVSALGDRSPASIVAGALTPPPPGILVKTQVDDATRADADGYRLSIHGTTVDTAIQTTVTAASQTRFSPLRAGDYRVAITDIAANCKLRGDSTRTVTVTDEGLATVQEVDFVADCRDPERGQIAVDVRTAGDNLDADGYQVVVTGVASDASLPDAQRAYLQRTSVAAQGTALFTNLRPGHYSVTLEGVAGNCTAPANLPVDVDVVALDDITKSLTVRCAGIGDDPTRPLVLESRWSSATAAPGSNVSLDVGLDLRAADTLSVVQIQSVLGVDPAVVRYDSAVGQGVWTQGLVHENAPGQVSWFTFRNFHGGQHGLTTFYRFYFTVVGAAGSSTTVSEQVEDAKSDIPGLDESKQIDLLPLIRRVNGTLTITPDGGGGSGGGAGGNQAPTARPGTGYSGTAGVALTLNGSGSSDPDGSITAYNWTFGDGNSATGASPTHTYLAAGTYTVTLTVTDNQGAQASASTTVTIASSGGGNDGGGGSGSGPFVWQSSFGAVNESNIVALTISLDLTADISETSGAEALKAWAVNELRWDPAVLQYYSFNFGTGVTGTVNTTSAFQGKLSFNSGGQAYNLQGDIAIATIQFKVIGSAGSSTTTHTTLGALTGTTATGSFAYTPKTTVVEATYPGSSTPPPPPPPPASKYQYKATWGAISGDRVDLTLSFDPSTYNDPAVNGGATDDVSQFQAQLQYSTQRLQWESCSNASTGAGGFTNLNANEIAPGQVSILNFKNGTGATGAIKTAVCTFTVKAGGATSVTTATTLQVLGSFSGADLIPNTQVTEGTLSIP